MQNGKCGVHCWRVVGMTIKKEDDGKWYGTCERDWKKREVGTQCPYYFQDVLKKQVNKGVENTLKSINNQKGSASMETNTERHKRVCYELNALYDRKNRDYGDSFHESWKDYGITMAAIRLGDKYNRLKNLTSGKTVQNVADETVRDTLLDLANYSIMTLMEMDAESKPEPIEWVKEDNK